MEIPVINRIGNFEASLQNPSSFLSQAITFSGVETVHLACRFWKWGALILALVASFSTIIHRIKILIIHIQNHYLRQSPPSQQGYSSDADTDISYSPSTSSSSDYEEFDQEEDEQDGEATTSTRSYFRIDDDYTVKGSGHYIDDQWRNRNLRKRRNSSFEDLLCSWSEKNVVKLWDNLGFGLGLNLQKDSRNCVSLYDMNRDFNLFSIFGEKSDIPAVSTSSSSPAVIVSAESNVTGQLLRVWDMRVGSRIPEILADWRPVLGKFVGTSGGGGGGGCGVEKVYVRDDVTGRLTVGDVRKANSPLVNLTETDVDRWWDADGVSVGEED